jgi:hypothetical protein
MYAEAAERWIWNERQLSVVVLFTEQPVAHRVDERNVCETTSNLVPFCENKT